MNILNFTKKISNKYAIILGIFLIVVFICSVSFINLNSNKHIITSAKIPNFDSISEMEQNSNLIVIVKKTNEEPVSYNLGEGHFDNFTISNVTIEKVIKPMSGKNLKKGDVIQILESEWQDKTTKSVYHTEGYTKMINSKKYTLFLGYNVEVNNYYPIGLLYGKIPNDKNEKLFYGDYKNEKIEKLISKIFLDKRYME